MKCPAISLKPFNLIRVLLLIISAHICSTAIACSFQDEVFDIYPNGISLHGLNGWEGWDNNPVFTAFVTQDHSLSPPQSVDINGASDLVYPLCGSGGAWSYSAWQYIPSDYVSGSGPDLNGSFFVLLNRYPIDADPGTDDWSVQMQFDSNDGMLKVYYGNGLNTVNVPYETDRWVKIQAIIDTENDWTHIYYDGELITEYSWTGGVIGNGGGAFDIAAVDLYANGSSSIYYDDLKLESISPDNSCGEPGTVKLAADLNFDLHVNLLDLQSFGLDWLGGITPSDIFPPSCGDGATDLLDFSAFATDWGKCADPVDPTCNAKPLTLYEPPGSSIGSITVLPFSGEFTESAVDMHIPGRGIDFSWARTYRSRLGFNTVMGNGWDFSHNIHVGMCGSSIFLNGGNSRSDRYRLQPNGTWVSGGFFRRFLQNPDTTLTLIFPDSGRWNFHPLDGSGQQGKIKEMIDRNGNTIGYEYNPQGQLVKIHDTLDTASHNRDITITYNPNGFIESITDYTGRSVIYEYYNGVEPGGNFGDLKSVTSPAVTGTPTGNDFPNGKTTVYTYSAGFESDCLNHNLLTITDPKGQTYLTNTYYSTTNPAEINFDRVTRQVLGDLGDIIDFTYLQQVPDPNNNYAVTRVVVNDRVGNVSESFYDNRNRIVVDREYTGRANPDLPTSINPDSNLPVLPLRTSDPSLFETRFTYNADSLPLQITLPNINEELFVYDSSNPDVLSRGNLLQHTLLAGPLGGDQSLITELFEYDPLVNNNTNFLTRHVDPRGNETLHEYDSRGNVTSTTSVRSSAPNIIESWTYDAFGLVTSHTLPDNGSGSQRQDAYNYYNESDGPQNGYLKESIVGSGVFDLTITYEYDTVGNMTRIIDPNGSDTQLIFNQLDQVVRTITPEVTDGSGVRYEKDTRYDENENIIRIDVQNIDDDGLIDSVEPYIATVYEYDILNYLTRTTQDVGPAETIVTEYEYDDNRNKTLVRFGDSVSGARPSNTVRALYDERDLVFEIIRAESDPNHSTTQYDYDGNRNLIRVSQGTEDTPNVTYYVCDGFDRRTLIIDPMGNETELHYDENSNPVTAMNKGELIDNIGSSANIRLHEVTNQYDELDRLIISETSFFDPLTQSDISDGKVTTQLEYSDVSQLVRITDDQSRQRTYEYDDLNRIKIETDPKGNSKTYGYDEKSNVTSIELTDKSDLLNPDDTFTTTYVYDNMDRRIRTIDNVGNITQNRYDSRGNLTSTTDASGNETRYAYDSFDRLVEIIRDMDGDGADGDSNDIVIVKVWNDSSGLITETDDNGNTTTYVYDSLDRMTRIIYADGTSSTSQYDVHDNLIEYIDANGSRATYTHDSNGKTKGGLYIPDTGISSDTTFQNFDYDGLGRIVSAQNDGSTVLRIYDSISNATQETLNGTLTSSTYGSLGNKLTCSYPGGRVLNYSYDGLDRIKSISDTAAGPIGTYDYIGGRVERLQYGNGTESGYAYDSLGRITARTHLGSVAGIIDERTFIWDPLNNKTQRKDLRVGGPELTHTYEYDPMYRLTRTIVEDFIPATVRDTQYTLDGVGNRINVVGVGTVNPGPYLLDPVLPVPGDFQMNQYTQIPWLDIIEYDDNGNLTATYPSAARPPVTSTYDVLDRLVEVTDLSTGNITTYVYDAMDRRIWKTIAGPAGPPTTTHYYYDGVRVIEEQNDTGTTLATYVYGNYIDEVLSMQRGGIDYYYHADDMFNIMALTDNSGTVVERYEYDDYGKPDFVLTTGVENPYLFNGRRYDSETGLYYYRSRYMDPRAGRFTSRDTIGSWGDSGSVGNGNAYAGNNPWSNLDPFGQAKEKFQRDKIHINIGTMGRKKSREIVVVGSKVKEVVRSAMKVRPLNDRVLVAPSSSSDGGVSAGPFIPGGEPVGYSTKVHLLTGQYMNNGGSGDGTTVRFRPLRITPKPSVTGTQTARVVGPSGEEIYTDEYGRIKVRFGWDRSDKHDENSSCWIRVSQAWAGVSFCIQYRETDFNFVSRLMEEEGIWWGISGDSSYSSPGERVNRPIFGAGLSHTREHILLGRQVGIPASSKQGTFYSRVSERLRHKSRGINQWDYERLILPYNPPVNPYILKKEEGGRHTPFHNKYRPQF